MSKTSKIIAKVIIGILGVGIVVVQWILPPLVEKSMNIVVDHPSYVVSDRAKELHTTLDVADLHADSLLWKRSILDRADRGHTDVPRLLEGNVALQVMTAVTKSPPGLNVERNTADKDDITMLAVAQLWPIDTWGSLLSRALYQSDKLFYAAQNSAGKLQYVKTAQDLRKVIVERAKGIETVGAIYGLEGAHPLEGKLKNLDILYDSGVRMLGITHFFDNELAGSLHGISGAGLTDFGRAAIIRSQQLGMIIDLAHVSEQAVSEILPLLKRPPLVSHTGFKGHCDTPRNIKDSLMQDIAKAGGVIGVGFWDKAICDVTPAKIAEAIQYGVTLVGVDHVALGSDFDGTVTTALDSSEMVAITGALLDIGMSDGDIRKIMGQNTLNFFLAYLPIE